MLVEEGEDELPMVETMRLNMYSAEAFHVVKDCFPAYELLPTHGLAIRVAAQSELFMGEQVVLLIIIGIYFWATYNSLVTLKVRVDEAWSDITVQLKRRGATGGETTA